MTNFEFSFRVGIDAARQAEFKRNEVARVIREFGAALNVATEGMLTVKLARSSNAVAEFVSAFRSGLDRGNNGLYVMTTEEPARAEQIAGWRQSPDGYPCWIIQDGKETACMDRAGLEEELQRLAASPLMGSIVLNLMGMPSEN